MVGFVLGAWLAYGTGLGSLLQPVGYLFFAVGLVELATGYRRRRVRGALGGFDVGLGLGIILASHSWFHGILHTFGV